jgi:hypothetical protein
MGCLGLAGVEFVVVPVLVAVVSVPEAVVLVEVDVTGAATLPVSLPAFVTRNVTASSTTPRSATIAGRGRSIR